MKRTTALLALGLLALAGCSPAPEPKPEPTPPVEDEAITLFEAYVDALNHVDFRDPATFDAVYDLTTNESNAGARESFTTMHAQSAVKTGDARITAISARATQASTDELALDVCLDVSGVLIVDAKGSSLVADGRPSVQRIGVTVVHARVGDSLVIADIFGRSEGPQC